jgi:hypothetical protein
MARITRDDREYCVGNKKCVDCYAENKDIEAGELQQREKRKCHVAVRILTNTEAK